MRFASIPIFERRRFAKDIEMRRRQIIERQAAEIAALRLENCRLKEMLKKSGYSG
jgi:hypothetical protein